MLQHRADRDEGVAFDGGGPGAPPTLACAALADRGIVTETGVLLPVDCAAIEGAVFDTITHTCSCPDGAICAPGDADAVVCELPGTVAACGDTAHGDYAACSFDGQADAGHQRCTDGTLGACDCDPFNAVGYDCFAGGECYVAGVLRNGEPCTQPGFWRCGLIDNAADPYDGTVVPQTCLSGTWQAYALQAPDCCVCGDGGQPGTDQTGCY